MNKVLFKRVHHTLYMQTIRLLSIGFLLAAASSVLAQNPPPGFVALFNGKDTSGWRGGDTYDHRTWMAMPEAERKAKDAEWSLMGCI